MNQGSKLRKHVHEDDRPPRNCTCCRSVQPAKGGHYVEYNGGINRKWVCAKCLKTNGDYNECD
jgi:hypothetical protein